MRSTGTALVTGAASGLGRATAARLHADGMNVVLVDVADHGDDLGPGSRYVSADVTSEDAVAGALSVAQELGGLRVVVNCAGIAPAGRTVGREGPAALASFERAVAVNLVGTFNVARLVAAAMAAQDPIDGERGVIVNTASVAAYEGQIGQVAYAASKAGIVGMTLPMARDLAALQIRVVTIAPGLMNTPMFASFTPEAIASLEASVPHPARLGRPDEFASLVAHVVANPMLNGETIRLDGAIRMAPR